MSKKDFPMARQYLAGALDTHFKRELRQLLACHAALKALLTAYSGEDNDAISILEKLDRAKAALEGKI